MGCSPPPSPPRPKRKQPHDNLEQKVDQIQLKLDRTVYFFFFILCSFLLYYIFN